MGHEAVEQRTDLMVSAFQQLTANLSEKFSQIQESFTNRLRDVNGQVTRSHERLDYFGAFSNASALSSTRKNETNRSSVRKDGDHLPLPLDPKLSTRQQADVYAAMFRRDGIRRPDNSKDDAGSSNAFASSCTLNRKAVGNPVKDANCARSMRCHGDQQSPLKLDPNLLMWQLADKFAAILRGDLKAPARSVKTDGSSLKDTESVWASDRPILARAIIWLIARPPQYRVLFTS